MTPIEHRIKGEIYLAMEKLGATPKLLACVGSWGDTLPDPEVLALLKTWNTTGEITLDHPTEH